MSYQEVYNGLNKKASSEQIKKLASIIGMKKKAAEDDNLTKLPPGNPVRQYLAPVVKDIKNTESYLPQSKTQPMTTYSRLSEQARDAINPWGGSKTVPGERFNRLWKVFHDWKTKGFANTGKFPTFKNLGRPMDLDSFNSGKPNSLDQYHANQINSLMSEFWDKEYPGGVSGNTGKIDEYWENLYDLMRKRIKELQKDPGKLQIPKEKYQQWYEHPEQIFLDLSQNKGPTYSQQLYS